MPLDYASHEPRSQRRRIDFWLVAIVLLGLAIRVGWVVHVSNSQPSLERLPDQVEYLELGRNLLAGHGLQFIDTRLGGTLYAYRTPGYPAFIALCRADVRVVRIAQAILDASNILAVYWLTRLFAGRVPSLLGASVIAFNPFLIYFCGLILSETLFIAMLMWGMLLLITPIGRWGGWLAGIVLLTLSILVRPSAIGLPVALALGAVFVNRHGRRPYDIKWLPPVGAIAVLLTFCTILPWAWRNQRILNRWIWSTTNGGITLYDGFNPDATGASDQSFTLSMPQLQSMGEVARSDYLGGLARQFVRDHPDRVIPLTLAKIGRTWSPMPLSAEYGSNPKLTAVALAFMLPFDVLIIIGLLLGDAPRGLKTFLLIPAVYFTVVHAASVGSLRYRIPADVPMAVIAGIACGQLSVVRKRRDSTLLATNN